MFVNALLIEDSQDDALLVQRLADESGLPVGLRLINDAEAALEYLSAAAQAGGAADLPRFVLLDISLPRLSGFDVLRSMKSDPALQDIPVIILSGTEDDDEFRRGQDLKAHSHIVKPMTSVEFRWIVESVRNYWPRLDRIRELERTA